MLLYVLLVLALRSRVASSLEPLSNGWDPLDYVQDDYVSIAYPHSGAMPRLFNYVINSTVPSTGRPYTMYVAVLQSGLPSSFTLELPSQGCCHRMKTSSTASFHNCSYATNAGFFNTKDGCCIGSLITNGKIVQVFSLSRVNFALGKEAYQIGYMSESVLKSSGLQQCVSGAGWLVRNGSSYVNKSQEIEGLSQMFVSEKAPRSGVGVAANGSLFLLQVDGEEDKKEGLDLWEFAEVAVSCGLVHLVNLDGGGSSVSVQNGKVIDRPTCLDNSLVCERPVTSITCMHY